MAGRQPRNVTRDDELRAIDAAIRAGKLHRVTYAECFASDAAGQARWLAQRGRGSPGRNWRWRLVHGTAPNVVAMRG
jgi:hypothetical protein